jgi:hypothetical protein
MREGASGSMVSNVEKPNDPSHGNQPPPGPSSRQLKNPLNPVPGIGIVLIQTRNDVET